MDTVVSSKAFLAELLSTDGGARVPILIKFQISTALLMLVATLWGGTGMGFWHGAQFYEFNRVGLRIIRFKSRKVDGGNYNSGFITC